MKKILSFGAVAILSILATSNSANGQTVPTITWTNTDGSTSGGSATQTNIIGGPWTLGNGPVVPSSNDTPPNTGSLTQTLNYCGSNAVVGQGASTTRNTSDGTLNGTNLTNIFQPYYFPFIVSHGDYLQGYFDYRPKDTNEAIVSAYSTDGGNNWIFQQEALELNPGLCPVTNSSITVSPAGSSNNATVYPSKSNKANPYSSFASVLISLSTPTTVSGGTNYTSPGATDDGQGHPYVTNINGVNYLYTLDRSVNYLDNSGTTSVDNLGLVVHKLLSATPSQPIGSSTDTPLTSPDVTCSSGSCVPNTSTSKGTRTVGLQYPDGILSEVPDSYPRTILYISKQLNYASFGSPKTPPGVTPNITNGACALPQIGTQTTVKKTNTDYVTVRLATTTDGINFTDKGLVSGLNIPDTTSYSQTRWIAPTGTLIKISNTRYGLFFAGGNCIDADSDSFHYIGYAESSNLKTWTVINGVNNPIASVSTVTGTSTPVPLQDGTTFTSTSSIPSTPPLITTQQWFAQRVYSPNVMLDPTDSTKQTYLVFVAGYTTKSPSDYYPSYRTITRFVIKKNIGSPN